MEFFRKTVCIIFFEGNLFDSMKFVILIGLLFSEVLDTRLMYFWENMLFHQYVWLTFLLKAFRNTDCEGTSPIWLLQKIQS